MRFILKEDLDNTYYRYYLSHNDKNYNFFITLGKYLNYLYNTDNEIYDDFNYSVSLLEYKIKVPDLDYKNSNYVFAFTANGLKQLQHELEDVEWYIDEYSPFTLNIKEIKVNDHDIVYRDDYQIALEK